jgi:putative ABC transport system permease protein
MTLKRLRLRSLLFHWRGNLAVFLGVVVGTAVLTGALLVGASLRGSLRQRTLQQIGWVEEALIAPRFFRSELADDLALSGAADRVCPVVMLRATVVVRQRGANEVSVGPIRRQVGGVTVLGVDDRFWSGWSSGQNLLVKDSGGCFCLNSTLAGILEVSAGDKVSLRLQKPSAVPRETLLGRRDDSAVIEEWTMPVDKVLTPDDAGDHFSLRPQLEAPRTVFVPLQLIQNKLGLVGRCNALLTGGIRQGRSALAQTLHDHLQLDDWGLVWKKNLGYWSLESKQLFIEPFIADTALKVAEEEKIPAAPTLVYLANTIAAEGQEIPYSIVAALDPTLKPPLGPYLPPGVKQLAEDEIVLADWKDSPLPRKIGEKVTLRYFPPDHQGELREQSASFRLAGFVPVESARGALERHLVPELPGITDKLKIGEWDPPFPYDNSRIKPRDEKYWQEYRTTPKAYVNLAVGQRLWGNRFGRLTSIRFELILGIRDETRGVKVVLLRNLDPEKGGFVFNPLKEQALRASTGGTDFAQLFLGFSSFLIAASLLLVGLLFRLNIDRRAEEIGLLLAVGYRRSAVRRLLLGEGAVLAAAGAVVGSCLAMLYARLLLQLLAAMWPGETLRSILRPYYDPLSLAVGAGAAFLVSLLTVAWAVFSIGRVAPSALLAGQMPGEGEKLGRRRPSWSWGIAAASLLGGIALLPASSYVTDHEMRAMTFFGSGCLLLIACLAALSGWMRERQFLTMEGRGLWSVAGLGIRNAARHPGRSLLTAGLLASAAFLLVAVEAFRRRVDSLEAVMLANGGFDLVAESDLPLFRDLNSEEGRQEMREKLVPIYRALYGGDNAGAERTAKNAAFVFKELVTVVAFRVHAGDDASCLNLYQPLRPRLLGVPVSFIENKYRDHWSRSYIGGKDTSGNFRFAATAARTDSERSNPWTLLLPQEGEVPAFGEKNTVEWMLHTGLGGQITLPPDHHLRIDGLLSDSVFQSSLLVSEPNFLRMYPGHEGYNFFLIHTNGKDSENSPGVQHNLELAYADRGMRVTPTADWLKPYLAVENTYLSTFQALGGLGLLLGSLGLAVVLLRGVWERRGELALLRALGFRRFTLGWLVLAENAFLLLVGLLSGTLSALVAVAPHLLHVGGSIPWMHLFALLAGVVLIGLVAAALATASTLRAPLILALRRE